MAMVAQKPEALARVRAKLRELLTELGATEQQIVDAENLINSALPVKMSTNMDQYESMSALLDLVMQCAIECDQSDLDMVESILSSQDS